MLHINKIRTMYGLRYAIQGVAYTFDKKGNKIPYSSTVEYMTVNNKKQEEVNVAIFPLTETGLEKAKEIRKLLMKNSK